ncbi:hypothetical protein SAMN04489807_2158 [Microbacterium hydrocarbonoxydans]|uniref:Uncharacterized protein n=1 Tax=Microbacterium hydrocarbonoxydans TaxID=273678 RepID=A0A1H4MJA0_9MICO|nr:hypothetical protein SAMN04489807_2158 [Microbacterium hydrocarbonoxydans]
MDPRGRAAGCRPPQIEAELVRLQKDGEEVAAELGKSRVSGVYADLVEYARDYAKGIPAQMPGAGTYEIDFTPWVEYMRSLELDAQRALVGRLSTRVYKGRGLDRVKIG